MKTHTLAFIFDKTLTKVLLMEKKRPEWQKGRVNGVGGKIEPGEESCACVMREVHEETGLETRPEQWVYVGEIKADSYCVDVYTAIHQGSLKDAATITDEEVSWFSVRRLPRNSLSNIHWLVPLALDKVHNNKFRSCVVRYFA